MSKKNNGEDIMPEIKVNMQDLSNLLSCAKLYMDEATIRIGNGFAEVLEVDATHTQMLHGKIICDCEPCEIPVNLEKLIKAISAAGKDNATMEFQDGILTIRGAHSRIKVPTIYKESNFKWPAAFGDDAPATGQISPSLLAPMLSYGLYTNSGAAKFSIRDSKLTVEIGKSPDISEITSPDPATGESVVNIDLAYLDMLIKYVKGVPTVTVCAYGDDKPILFKWAEGTGDFRVLIAPRIED